MATGWFNNARHVQQPVFAAPNFIDRQNNNIFGLMIPAAIDDNHENQPRADHPVELHLDQMVNFDCEIVIGKGYSLDALTDYVKKTGLPAPSYTREELIAQLHRYAHLYNTLYWSEGHGFGVPQGRPGTPWGSPAIPDFLKKYVEMFPDSADTAGLKEKMAWCEANTPRKAVSAEAAASYYGQMPKTKEEAEACGDVIISWQKEDGSFAFEPDGRHYTKDDFVVARSFIEPMGNAGDPALDICVLPALKLMQMGEMFGITRFYDAARKALDFCLPMIRPEGGDYWECPLHSPNLFAGGHAANAYYLAYRILGEEKYLKAAIYWIRSLLAFTHLWEPAKIPMLYNTKPCLCSSEWYFANWVRDHVQWEVLATFNQAAELGIDWSKIDTEIDWALFQEGVTAAGVRWTINAHKDGNWLPHNLPFTYAEYVKGSFDGCFPDTHNSVTGYYGGAMIMPAAIASNLVNILERK